MRKISIFMGAIILCIICLNIKAQTLLGPDNIESSTIWSSNFPNVSGVTRVLGGNNCSGSYGAKASGPSKYMATKSLVVPANNGIIVKYHAKKSSGATSILALYWRETPFQNPGTGAAPNAYWTTWLGNTPTNWSCSTLDTWTVPSSQVGGKTITVMFWYAGILTDAVTVDDVEIDLVPPPCTGVTTVTVSPSSDQTICSGNSMTFTATANGDSPFTYQWKKNGVNISGATSSSYTATTAGSYTCYVTNCSGANNATSTSRTLTVNSLPSAPTVSNQSGCFGGSIPSLTATGGVTYKWYSDAGLTNLVATGSTFNTGQTAIGTYTYYVTNSQGYPTCTSASTSATLTINASPTVNAGNDQTIIPGLSTVLKATGNGPFTWSTGTTNDSIIVKPTTNTTYTVSVINNHGCSAIDSIIVNADASLLKLTDNYCNKTGISPFQTLKTNLIPEADFYQFKITNGAGFNYTYEGISNNLPLYKTGVKFNTNYDINIRVIAGKDTSVYGSTCNISIKDSLSNWSDSTIISILNQMPRLTNDSIKDLIINNSPISNRIVAELLTMDSLLNIEQMGEIYKAQPRVEIVINNDDLTNFNKKQILTNIVLRSNIIKKDQDIINWNIFNYYKTSKDTVWELKSNCRESNANFQFDYQGDKKIILNLIRNGIYYQTENTLFVKDSNLTNVETGGNGIRLKYNMDIILRSYLNLFKNKRFVDTIYAKSQNDTKDITFKDLNPLFNNLLDSMTISLKQNGGNDNEIDFLKCIVDSFYIPDPYFSPRMFVPKVNSKDLNKNPIISNYTRRFFDYGNNSTLDGYQIQNGKYERVNITNEILTSNTPIIFITPLKRGQTVIFDTDDKTNGYLIRTMAGGPICYFICWCEGGIATPENPNPLEICSSKTDTGLDQCDKISYPCDDPTCYYCSHLPCVHGLASLNTVGCLTNSKLSITNYIDQLIVKANYSIKLNQNQLSEQKILQANQMVSNVLNLLP